MMSTYPLALASAPLLTLGDVAPVGPLAKSCRQATVQLKSTHSYAGLGLCSHCHGPAMALPCSALPCLRAAPCEDLGVEPPLVVGVDELRLQGCRHHQPQLSILSMLEHYLVAFCAQLGRRLMLDDVQESVTQNHCCVLCEASETRTR